MSSKKVISSEPQCSAASLDTLNKSRKLFRKLLEDVQISSIEGFSNEEAFKTLPKAGSYTPSLRSSSPGPVRGFESFGIIPRMVPTNLQTKFDIQEWIIVRSFTFSLALVILIVILICLGYQLIGDYLTLIFFSLITSLALRPVKRELKLHLRSTLGFETHRKHKTPFFTRSLIYKGASKLLQISKTIFLARSTQKQLSNPSQKFFKMNFLQVVSDVYGLGYLTLAYFLHSRLGLDTCIILCAGTLLADLLSRILLDIFKEIFGRLAFCRRIGLRLHKNAKVHEIINYLATTVVILFFLLGLLGLLTIAVTLLFVDLQEILINAQTFIQKIVNYVNFYLGDSSPFDEEHLIAFVKKYHDSIGSFLNHTELNGTYTAISFILASYNQTGNRSRNSFFKNLFPNITDIQTHGLESREESALANSSCASGVWGCHNREIKLLIKRCMNETSVPAKESFFRKIKMYNCIASAYTTVLKINFLDILDRIHSTALFIGRLVFGTLLIQFFMFLKAAMSWFFNVTIFFSSVYYLLHSKKNFLLQMTKILPLSEELRLDLSRSITDAITGVYICSFKIFIYHFFLTWLLLDVQEIKLAFITAIVAGALSIIPLLSPWVLCLPSSLYLYFGQSKPFEAVILPIVYYILSTMAFSRIYEKHIIVHSYMAGLSVVMGTYAFDLKGIIYGPLLVCMMLILYNAGKNYMAYVKMALISDGYKTNSNQQESTPNNTSQVT